LVALEGFPLGATGEIPFFDHRRATKERPLSFMLG
jgi:hypothetical protein